MERHINIRYFFVKDCIDKGELGVKHCPMELMVADYFTKPLQERLFHYFRNIIMGCAPLDEVLEEISIKERVGNSNCDKKSDKIENSSMDRTTRDLIKSEAQKDRLVHWK